jgi:hypothetical protein
MGEPALIDPPCPASPHTRPLVAQSLQLSVFTGACGTHVTDVAALLAPPGVRRLRRLWVRAPQIQEPALVAIGRLTGLEVGGAWVAHGATALLSEGQRPLQGA